MSVVDLSPDKNKKDQNEKILIKNMGGLEGISEKDEDFIRSEEQ